MRGADSCFYCGTAAEIVGLESLDNAPFKLKWEDSLGSVIQQAYKNLIRARIVSESSPKGEIYRRTSPIVEMSDRAEVE
jgi:hypothetical protein